MRIKNEILERLPDFVQLCKEHQVKFLYAFGSAINQSFDETYSDIDLIVEIESNDPLERGDLLIGLWDKLELFFGRKVDLLTESSIKNPFLKKEIDRTRKLIYDGEKEEIFS